MPQITASRAGGSGVDRRIVATDRRQYRDYPLRRKDKDAAVSPRTEGSRRVDGATEIHMPVFIRRGRELRFGFDDILVLLALGAPGKALCADVREIVAHHPDDIRSKIADLRKLEKLPAKAIAQCSGSKHQIVPS